MLFPCTFFLTSGKVCECVCVCVCCIGRDSEKDESLLWLGQQNTVIFSYFKSICLKVNRKILATHTHTHTQNNSEFSRYCFSSLSHRFIILKFLKIFPREFPQTTNTSFTWKKKEYMGLTWWSSVTTALPLQGAGLRSLVAELRSPCQLVWAINKWGMNMRVSVARTLPVTCDPPGTWSWLSAPCGLTGEVMITWGRPPLSDVGSSTEISSWGDSVGSPHLLGHP